MEKKEVEEKKEEEKEEEKEYENKCERMVNERRERVRENRLWIIS